MHVQRFQIRTRQTVPIYASAKPNSIRNKLESRNQHGYNARNRRNRHGSAKRILLCIWKRILPSRKKNQLLQKTLDNGLSASSTIPTNSKNNECNAITKSIQHRSKHTLASSRRNRTIVATFLNYNSGHTITRASGSIW